MIYGSGGSKSRLAKAAGAEPCGQRRNEKLHAAVAQSTCSIQNVQSTPLLEVGMWKTGTPPVWCEAHFNSKCTKHTMFGLLLEVPISKRCPTDEIDRSIDR